jgi:hypothetical protein
LEGTTKTKEEKCSLTTTVYVPRGEGNSKRREEREERKK